MPIWHNLMPNLTPLYFSSSLMTNFLLRHILHLIKVWKVFNWAIIQQLPSFSSFTDLQSEMFPNMALLYTRDVKFAIQIGSDWPQMKIHFSTFWLDELRTSFTSRVASHQPFWFDCIHYEFLTSPGNSDHKAIYYDFPPADFQLLFCYYIWTLRHHFGMVSECYGVAFGQ